MLLNSREPVGKQDNEDENMKLLRLMKDIKKYQKKWKGGDKGAISVQAKL
jgi:hypothetical protein